MENNNEHPYNPVYLYEAILKEVKDLILPTILRKITFSNVYIVLDILSKEEYAEFIYNQIMVLGYYRQDIHKSVEHLMPGRNRIIYQGHEEADYANMAFLLDGIAEDFELQVNAFKVFYQMTQDLKPYNEVIKNFKKQIEPLKYEEYYEDYSDMYKKVWIKSEILSLKYEITNEEFQNATVEELENKLKNIIWQINHPHNKI